MALLAERQFETGGRTLHLVMDNGAVIAAEDLRDRSLGGFIGDIAKAEAIGESPKRGTMAALLYGATRLNDPDLTDEACMDMVVGDPALSGVLIDLLIAYLKLKEPDAGEAQPPKAAAPKRKRRVRKTGNRS